MEAARFRGRRRVKLIYWQYDGVMASRAEVMCTIGRFEWASGRKLCAAQLAQTLTCCNVQLTAGHVYERSLSGNSVCLGTRSYGVLEQL